MGVVLILSLFATSAFGAARKNRDNYENSTRVDSTKVKRLDELFQEADSGAIYQLSDTLVEDSVKRRIDTLIVSGGVLPIINEQYLNSDVYAASDSIEEKEVEIRRPYSKLAMERNPIFKDSVDYGNTILYSALLPGFGQLYNNQAWKIPILYGGLAGFTTGAVMIGSKYRGAKSLYEEAVKFGAPSDLTATRYHEMSRYKTQRSLMIAGAMVTYAYFLCDAAMNYKGEVHSTRKATILAALCPGAGQVYNKKYWKLPIVYGGFLTMGYVIAFNNKGYQRYKMAYDLRTDGDDKTVDIYSGIATETQLQNTRDSFRRYRDLGYILLGGFYMLQIIDAHVDAYLNNYDVSDNLSLRVEPVILPAPNLSKGIGNDMYGIGMKLNF